MDTTILPYHISLINSNSDAWQDFNDLESTCMNIYSKLRKNLHEFKSL